MVQEIKLKVDMHSEKCRKEVMKVVSKLSGVNELSVDLQNEMLVVIGDVDPVCIATCLRKKRWVAKILSVGEKEEKEKGEDKNKDKDDDKDDPKQIPIMYCNAPYEYGYGYGNGYYAGYPPPCDRGGCIIL